jgi:DNA polymerase-3 subunit gamma/tau
MLLKGVEEMQYSSHPRLAFEMALIRAAEAGNVVPVAELLGKLETMQSGGVVASIKKEVAPRVPAQKPRVKEKSKSEAPQKAGSTEIPEKPGQQQKKAAKNRKAEEPVKEEPVEAEAPSPQATEEGSTENTVEPPTRDVRKNWDEFIEYVMDRKKWMAHTLRPVPKSARRVRNSS